MHILQPYDSVATSNFAYGSRNMVRTMHIIRNSDKFSKKKHNVCSIFQHGRSFTGSVLVVVIAAQRTADVVNDDDDEEGDGERDDDEPENDVEGNPGWT